MSDCKYGNIDLAEMNDIVLSLLGKDLFLSFSDEINNKWNLNEQQSHSALGKRIDRLICGQDGDITLLGYSDNSITDVTLNTILQKLKTMYGVELDYFHKAIDYTWKFFKRGLTKEESINSELPIREKSHYYAEFFCKELNSIYPQDLKALRDEIIASIRSKYKSISYFCIEYSTKIHVTEEHLRNWLYGLSDDKPTWATTKRLLDAVEDKSIRNKLFEIYFCANYVTTKQKKLCNDKDIAKDYENSNWNSKSDIIRGIVRVIIENWLYKKDIFRAQRLVNQIKHFAPEASLFYCNWLNGFIEVAKGEYNEASSLYAKAFDARRFAGNYMMSFLCQAIALSLKNDFNINAARDSKDPNKNSKTPLPNSAKKYWNYAFAIGLEDKKAEDAYIEAYNWCKQFDLYFPREMFINNQKENGSEIKVGSFNTIVEELSKLQKLTDKGINIRRKRPITLDLFELYNDETEYPPIIVALICARTCYLYNKAEYAEKFMELINSWLTQRKNINFNTLSNAGSTIAADAIKQYGILRRNNYNKTILKRFREIAFETVKQTSRDYLSIECAKKRHSALQEAIDAFDYDFVVQITDIIDFKNHKNEIYTQDGMTLINYCNKRISIVQNGEIPTTNVDYDLNMMNVPGLTLDDKRKQFNNVMETISKEKLDIIRKMTYRAMYGLPEISKQQELKLLRIRDYLTKI